MQGSSRGFLKQKIRLVLKSGCRQARAVRWNEKAPWFSEASRRKRWLVGVSGGADSVALLRLLLNEGFSNLIVCHLDHRLRGRASTEDARFVQRLAAELEIPCEVAQVDVKKRMADHRESMETAARNARHEFFAACARKHRCPRILLAHHADDQAETVLWNLLRGSHGLKGMQAEQKITGESGMILEIHRPLLEIRRAELVEWLISNHHRWREDASNAQPVAIRNRLRSEALPLLAEISSRDPVAALVRGAKDTLEDDELMRWAASQVNALDPQGRLHVRVLQSLPQALQRAIIADFLKAAGVDQLDHDLLERALKLLDPNSPPAVNLPGGGWLRRREARLRIEGA